MVKNKDYKSNYHLTISNCQGEFWRFYNGPLTHSIEIYSPHIKILYKQGRLLED